MPPSRFLAQQSKWRNAVAQPGKPEERYEELGTSYASSGSTSAADELHSTGTLLRAGPWPLTPHGKEAEGSSPDTYGYKPRLLVRSAAPGSLLLLDLDKPGKKKKQVPSLNVSQGAISDFDVAPWWDTSADDEHEGSITVAAASGSSKTVQVTKVTKPWANEGGKQLSQTFAAEPSVQGISCLQWHPSVPGLLLGSGGNVVHVWNSAAETSGAALSLTTDNTSDVIRQAAWNLADQGHTIGATTSGGNLVLWDARAKTISAKVSSVDR